MPPAASWANRANTGRNLFPPESNMSLARDIAGASFPDNLCNTNSSKASSKPASLGQLKLTVENIKNSIGTSNATLSKIRIKNKKFLDKQVDKAAKGREEKKLEKSPLKSTASTVGNIGKSIAAGPMNIFSKLWQFGSLMLMGILVNNLPIIIEKIMGVVRVISNIGSSIANGFKTIGNIVGKITGGGNKEHEEKKKKFDKDVESLEKKGEEVKNIIPKSIRDKFQWIKDALAGKGGKETLKRSESAKKELEEHQKFLEAIGHKVSIKRKRSGLHVAKKVSEGYIGGADSRREGLVVPIN